MTTNMAPSSFLGQISSYKAPPPLATRCRYIRLARYREVRYFCFIDEVIMLAKKTSKNQVTLPIKALKEIPETDYFDVTTKGGVLILRPVTVSEPGSRLATVRQKIKDLGIEPKDLDRAITWAKGRRGRRR